MLFAETIPISYCRKEKGIEVLVCSCINCKDFFLHFLNNIEMLR